jgi:hypothetical protein
MPVFEIEANGKSYEVEAPDQSAALAAIGNIPKPPMTAADVGIDAAKGLGSGAVRGTAYMLGQGGDINELARKGIGKLQSSGTVSPQQVSDAQGQVAGITDWVRGNFGMAPGGFQSQDYGSQKIMDKVDSATGLPMASYQPKSDPGKLAQSVGTLIPSGLMSGAGMVRGAVLPGLLSETARSAAEGSGYEVPAAIGGAVLGGSLLPSKTAITSADLLKGASRRYQSPEVTDLRLDPAGPARVGNQIIPAIEAKGARPYNAAPVYSATDELKNLPSGTVGQSMVKAGLSPSATIEDVKGVRTLLGTIRKDATDPLTGSVNTAGNAAGVASRKISDYLDNIPAADVRSGDAAAASAQLSQATKDWAQGKKLKLVEELSGRAERRAGSTYSGGNLNNTNRQELRKIFDNKRMGMGFSKEELAAAKRAVMGTATGNVARYIGKAFAPTGPVPIAANASTIAAAQYLTGDPQTAGMIGGGLAGLGILGKGIGNASTARQVARFSDIVAKGAPSAKTSAAMRAAGIEPTPRNIAAMQALLLSHESRRPESAPSVPQSVYQGR